MFLQTIRAMLWDAGCGKTLLLTGRVALLLDLRAHIPR